MSNGGVRRRLELNGPATDSVDLDESAQLLLGGRQRGISTTTKEFIRWAGRVRFEPCPGGRGSRWKSSLIREERADGQAEQGSVQPAPGFRDSEEDRRPDRLGGRQ